jgi:hypothetical protein
MLEMMRETHATHLLPRVEACHAAMEAFAQHCIECKVGRLSLEHSATVQPLVELRVHAVIPAAAGR